MLLLGDLIYPRGDPETYQHQFADPYKPVLDARIPIKAVLGNHDIPTSRQAIIEKFKMPARYYTFTQGKTQFFALDSSPGAIDQVERAWLEEELRGSAATWKVVFMHHPMFSSGIHGSTLPVRSALEETFVRRYAQTTSATSSPPASSTS